MFEKAGIMKCMFIRTKPSQPNESTVPLGACGYPHGFLEALTRLDSHARAQKHVSALVLVSVDNLAMIMSGYSMAVAEAVMEEIAHVIRQNAPANVEILRVQRDQFGVLIANSNEEFIARWCETLETAIRDYSYSSRYGELHCLSSTAYQMLPDALTAPSETLGRAIVALSDKPVAPAKLVRREDISGAENREEMGLANFLGQAIQENRIRLAYQPIIDSRTGEVAHYEALLRLFGEDGRINSAGILIPVAERMGFIPMIDLLVLEKVIAELRAAPNVRLAINVSNLTTLNSKWIETLSVAVDATPEIAPRLCVEITETAVHGDLEQSARFCAEVQSLGCTVALDDFGSGYTSFRQLQMLSIDIVKIDGAFIRDLSDNADSRLFVKTLVDFIRGFGLKSVAEYVENGEIAKMLMELGVDYLQGYYFGKPSNTRPWVTEE